MKLYHSPRTRSVRIYWLLEELGVPFELAPLEFTPDALKSPSYLEVHPLGKVPSFQDGDLTMFESGAMPPVVLIIAHTMLKPEAERIPAAVADGRNGAAAVLAVLERALAGQQYLLGHEFSAADIMMGYSLLLMKWLGLISEQYPNVAAYLARLQERPALQKALG